MRLRPLLAALLFAPVMALAQAWPSKPIRLIAPYPPGGQTDIVSRWLAERIGPALGQPVLVENRSGAQGIVGIEAARTSAPDGHTLVYVNLSNIAVNPHVFPKLPYDGQRDFAAVTQLGLTGLAMTVPASLGVKSLREFIAWAKANPGKANYASIGSGSTPHLYGEMLKDMAGIAMTHVPYKGAGPIVIDLLGAQVHMSILDLAAIRPHVEAGKLVALAMTGPRRWPGWEVPTFAEQGYAIDLAGWNGIMAPAGTPRAIIERLSAEIVKAVQSPEGREQMLKMGLLPTGTSPAAFAEVVRADTVRWGEVVRKAGVKLD
ncbi:MAG: Bug family tripartite tricarboxylate transporter substrate binding protein [Betaproteobacteria bacterium]